METLEVLRKARTEVARSWWDGRPESPGHCPVTAIGQFVCCFKEGHKSMSIQTLLAEKIAGRPLGCESVTQIITRWNDAPERTQAEVLALLDAVIADLTPAPVVRHAASRRPPVRVAGRHALAMQLV